MHPQKKLGKICKIEGCNNGLLDHNKSGYCSKHWNRGMYIEGKYSTKALGDGWIELDIAYPNKGIDVICQDEDGTTHYAFQCQCKQPGCREWRDQITGGGLMINPKRWRIENPLPLPPNK